MEYFIMLPDERVPLYKNLDYSNPGFQEKEPFVAYGDFSEEDQFPDFFYGKTMFHFCFCITDRLKDVLDVYSSNIQAIPFFLTDKSYRSQIVCWRIDCPVEDCLLAEGWEKENSLTLRGIPEENPYIFRVVREKAQYIIVSLELAENILRRRLYGVRFIPVRKGGSLCQ
ncbi:hypothetical protein [Lacrimispora sp. 38-1]|uniref:hypothetical protein n=1 Tax=Lacrimispora sp. 38-1 TaxID=3125778 RepID=UPI003CEC1472